MRLSFLPLALLAVACTRESTPAGASANAKTPSSASARAGGGRQLRLTEGAKAKRLGCDGTDINLLADLRLPEPVDYAETRFLGRLTGSLRRFTFGERCGGDAGTEACEKKLKAAVEKRGFRSDCIPELCSQYIAYRRGDEVGTIANHEALRSWLGPIDTPNEAMLWVWSHDYRVPGELRTDEESCKLLREERLRVVQDGYHMLATKRTSDCPLEVSRFILHIKADGSIREVKKEVVKRSDGCV